MGSVRIGTLELLKDKVDLSQIRVLAESRSYPSWVYAARAGLDPAVVEAVSRAMFALTGKCPNTPRSWTRPLPGHRPLHRPDFDPIRGLIAKLGLE